MTVFIIKRIFMFIPVLFLMAVGSFIIIHYAPGSPFSQDKLINKETLNRLNAEYGLDKPLHTQILKYLGNLAQGNLGYSTKYRNTTVNEIIAQSLPVSASLGLFALALTLLLGTIFGIIAAAKKNSTADHITMFVAMVGISAPNFVIASILLIVFSFLLKWVPAAGWGQYKHVILPGITLAAPYIAYVSRLMRASMLEVMHQDYITTARAKGLSEFRTVTHHAFKNALTPVISFLAPAASFILTGSIVVEKIFCVPGIGTHFVHSALHRDHFVAVGCALLIGLILLTLNLVADILYAVVNPRVRYDKS
ncbi:MAG: ABC transporter permease [bacterium]